MVKISNYKEKDMGLRSAKRKIAKEKMKKAGIEQPTKHNFKHVDYNGNATTVHRPSFFAMNWRNK